MTDRSRHPRLGSLLINHVDLEPAAFSFLESIPVKKSTIIFRLFYCQVELQLLEVQEKLQVNYEISYNRAGGLVIM